MNERTKDEEARRNPTNMEGDGLAAIYHKAAYRVGLPNLENLQLYLDESVANIQGRKSDELICKPPSFFFEEESNENIFDLKKHRISEDFMQKNEGVLHGGTTSLIPRLDENTAVLGLMESKEHLQSILVHRTNELLKTNQLLHNEIAERKWLEEIMLRKWNQLDEILSNVDAIILEGKPQHIDFVGGRVEHILGYTPRNWYSDPLGAFGFWMRHIHPEDRARVINTRRASIEKCQDHVVEYRMLSMGGEEVWFHDAMTVDCEDGIPIRTRSVMVDITEQKKAEERTKLYLREKEKLYWELQHRVKNNLQMLMSITDMMILRSENESVLKRLQDVHSVIETIALTNSRVFEGTSMVGLNLKSFLEELVQGLIRFKPRKDLDLEYTIEGDDVRLKTDQAIPLALMANELILNAVKYAFQGRKEGRLSISVQNTRDRIKLAIKDNGIGIPHNIDIHSTDSLGFKLARNLAEQLDGRIDLNVKEGCEFLIDIPKEEVE